MPPNRSRRVSAVRRAIVAGHHVNAVIEEIRPRFYTGDPDSLLSDVMRNVGGVDNTIVTANLQLTRLALSGNEAVELFWANAKILTCDGQPVRRMLAGVNSTAPPRITGRQLASEAISLFPERTFVLGGPPLQGVAQFSGYVDLCDLAEVVSAVSAWATNLAQPGIVLLALGSPKSEQGV